jgi:hypothetical protein
MEFMGFNVFFLFSVTGERRLQSQFQDHIVVRIRAKAEHSARFPSTIHFFEICFLGSEGITPGGNRDRERVLPLNLTPTVYLAAEKNIKRNYSRRVSNEHRRLVKGTGLPVP